MESTNLVELVKSVFNQDVLNHAASQLHENKANLEKALDGIVPAVLLRLEAKTTSSRSAVLQSLVNTSQNILGTSNNVSESLKNILADDTDPNGMAQVEKADSILNELFTDRLNPVIDSISRHSGITPSSGLRMMSLVAPATIATLHNGGDKTLLQLVPQKESIIKSVPSGFNLDAALGLDNLSQVDQTPTVPRMTDNAQQREPHKVSLIQWIIILVLAGGILFGFYTGCGSNRVGVTTELPPAPTTSTNNQ